MPHVYMQTILWKTGQIYFGNNYCDVSSLGIHISVFIASNKKQIAFYQSSKIVNLIFKFIILFH